MSSGFLAQYGSEIATLTIEHLWLTAAAMLFATAIAVPAGIWLTRAPRWARPVIGAANILQTIPSLAMFGFLLPLPWLGDRAARIAIVALTAYALLPILRNTYAGIRGIDPAVSQVARALGLTDRGVASVDNRLVLAGAIPAALLALAADAALGLLERRFKVPGK
jgi:osmoprotectant transport system permease protein